MRKKLIVFGSILLISSTVLFVVLLTFMIMKSRNAPSRGAVVRAIQELSRLETASFTVDTIIDKGNRDNVIQEFLFGDSIILIARGEVIAGFDLSKVTEDDIEVNNTEITVKLPPPMILTSRLDNEATRVYDRKKGIFTSGQKDLESQVRTEADAQIVQEACASGILESASTNATQQITMVLNALGFEKVSVTIPHGNCPLSP